MDSACAFHFCFGESFSELFLLHLSNIITSLETVCVICALPQIETFALLTDAAHPVCRMKGSESHQYWDIPRELHFDPSFLPKFELPEGG